MSIGSIQAELGVAAEARAKKTRKPQQQTINEYKQPYLDALVKLNLHLNTLHPKLAKLKKIECAAVLTLGFDSFASVAPNLKVLQSDLRDTIKDELKSNAKFWMKLWLMRWKAAAAANKADTLYTKMCWNRFKLAFKSIDRYK